MTAVAATAALVALTLALAPAVVPPPPPDEADIVAKPRIEGLLSALPPRTLDRAVAAEVTLRCTIRADAKAERCDVVTERPYGLGIGEVVGQVMAEKGRFRVRKVDGKPVDGGQAEFTLQLASLSSGRAVILNPRWGAAPGFEEMDAAWPAGLQAAEGVVVLRCGLQRSGDLGRCVSVNDADKALVEAARTLTGRFRLGLTESDARASARREVLVSLRFLNPATEGGRQRLVRAPEWIVALDPKAVQAIYPDAAAAAGVRSGRGTVDCLVAADGALTDCRVAAERPEGLGFGPAAAQVAGVMRLNLWSNDGRPTVGGRIRLPVEFFQSED